MSAVIRTALINVMAFLKDVLGIDSDHSEAVHDIYSWIPHKLMNLLKIHRLTSVSVNVDLLLC